MFSDLPRNICLQSVVSKGQLPSFETKACFAIVVEDSSCCRKSVKTNNDKSSLSFMFCFKPVPIIQVVFFF